MKNNPSSKIGKGCTKSRVAMMTIRPVINCTLAAIPIKIETQLKYMKVTTFTKSSQ